MTATVTISLDAAAVAIQARPKTVWELWIRREIEDDGWTIYYIRWVRPAVEDKSAGAYTKKCQLGVHVGSEYLRTRATHYDGELSGITQALEVAILTGSKTAN